MLWEMLSLSSFIITLIDQTTAKEYSFLIKTSQMIWIETADEQISTKSKELFQGQWKVWTANNFIRIFLNCSIVPHSKANLGILNYNCIDEWRIVTVSVIFGDIIYNCIRI